MDVFKVLFQIVADILERYPIITPITTLVGIISILTSIMFHNSKIGMISLAIFSGINLAIVYELCKGDISIGDFFTFLFISILVITLGVIFLPKLKLNSEVEPIITASLGLSVGPVLISIRVVNQIKELKKKGN